jgi:hypothetical protein
LFVCVYLSFGITALSNWLFCRFLP